MRVRPFNEKFKVAVASYDNPRAVSTWSGIPAHIIEELETQGHEVVSITLVPPNEPWYYSWLRSIHWRLSKKWFLASVEKKQLQHIGHQFDLQVQNSNPDIVIAIFGDILSYTTFKQPVCIVHDATFASIVNYYSTFSSLTARSLRSGHAMYKKALERADAAIFSSEWASNSAINDYGTAMSKVYTVPLGANLKEIPSREEVIVWQEKRAESDVCDLLFLGVDWERKGGPFSLEVVKELNRLGIKSQLIIVGCNPDIPVQDSKYVKKIGFLRKSKPEEAAALNQLLIQSHALILPSLAECYGCVFCEANAYGLPALGRDTGGIPEIIKEGVNGLLAMEGESAVAFAKRWSLIWEDRQKYAAMLQSSRDEYEERLNYEVFIKKLIFIFDQLLEKKQVAVS